MRNSEPSLFLSENSEIEIPIQPMTSLFVFQLNRMTSWIDGSFVYSTKEAWVNAMRTFVNGTFNMRGDPVTGMPMFNTQRIPMFNMPAPNVLKMQSPERMYRKLNEILSRFRLRESTYNIYLYTSTVFRL